MRTSLSLILSPTSKALCMSASGTSRLSSSVLTSESAPDIFQLLHAIIVGDMQDELLKVGANDNVGFGGSCFECA